MHLLIPFAVPPAEGVLAAVRSLALPRLQRLLAGSREHGRDTAPAATLSPPHERALARALGLPGGDGRVPWGAWHAGAAGIAEAAGPTWGVLTPCHWQLGSDAVAMGDPSQLALDEASSRALLDAVAPLLAEAGVFSHWDAPLRWLIAHPSMLADVPCAGLDRVVGRPVGPALPAGPGGAMLRRLHSEMQMLLHAHPLNEEREARGLPPVNSAWLWGCGALRTAHGAGGSSPAGGTAALPGTAESPRVDDRLRAPALAEDWDAWAAAWTAIDATLPAADAVVPGDRLTVCGERGCVTHVLGEGGLWSAWRTRLGLHGPATPWVRWEGL